MARKLASQPRKPILCLCAVCICELDGPESESACSVGNALESIKDDTIGRRRVTEELRHECELEAEADEEGVNCVRCVGGDGRSW